MTDLVGVGGPTSGPGRTGTTSGAGSLDYDAFLRLLTTQLTNQDPTAPMDSTDYVAQLATFAQVEQSIQTNARLDSLLTASALASAEDVIGRTATSADGRISGEVVAVQITRAGAVATLATGATLELGEGVRLS